jgi:hypothetical protein
MKHTAIILLVLVFIGASDVTAQSNQCRSLALPYQRQLLKADNSTELKQQSVQSTTAQRKAHEFWIGRGRHENRRGSAEGRNPTVIRWIHPSTSEDV